MWVDALPNQPPRVARVRLPCLCVLQKHPVICRYHFNDVTGMSTDYLVGKYLGYCKHVEFDPIYHIPVQQCWPSPPIFNSGEAAYFCHTACTGTWFLTTKKHICFGGWLAFARGERIFSLHFLTSVPRVCIYLICSAGTDYFVPDILFLFRQFNRSRQHAACPYRQRSSVFLKLNGY